MISKLTGFAVNDENDAYFSLHSLTSQNLGAYYFFSNDVFCNRVARMHSVRDAVYFGIGNNHFLHVLAELLNAGARVKRIVATDLSAAQLFHLYSTCQTIRASRDRVDFLERMLCVRFNGKAKEFLNKFDRHPKGYVHGSCKSDEFERDEEWLWKNLDFDAVAFRDKYGINCSKINSGLLMQFVGKNFGNLDSYYVSLLTGSERMYDQTAFTAAFGSGYLRNESSFYELKKLLDQVPFYYVRGDYSEISSDVFLKSRYETVLVWTSNMFSFDKFWFLYLNFIQRVKYGPVVRIFSGLIKKIWGIVSRNVDIVIYADERKVTDRYFRRPVSLNAFVPKPFRNARDNQYHQTIHTDAFRKVVKYFGGKENVHIAGNSDWVSENGGVSPLPNCRYMTPEAFLRTDNPINYTTVFCHELVSCGLPMVTLVSIVNRARVSNSRIIILEHNGESVDFAFSKSHCSVEDIRNVLGQEKSLDYSLGERCLNRNMILIY